MIIYLIFRDIKLVSWLCGLALAIGGDYVLLPWLVEKTGGMAIAVSVGLIVGTFIMFACTEGVQCLEFALRNKQSLTKVKGKTNKSQARSLPLTTRIVTWLILLTMTATLLSELLPPVSFK